MPLAVEIWSDVVCPWCFIGKRRFEAALARFERRDEVRVTWRSFELDPSAPPRGEGSVADALAAKYGMSREQADAMHAQMTELAAAEGLDFRFDRAQRSGTFDAHRLVHLAAVHGLADAMEERLMRAYFTEGEAVGDVETLARLADEVGVPAEEAHAVLGSDRYADAVRDDEALAARLGIRGVPFYVLGRRYGVSGAQPADALLAALRRAWDEAAGAEAA
jgi:predicted DsbA family dithiol-disulfide isomerase